ncbi:uncharacterized protein LOC119333921 [Triticum dicoccoides]|uniref:uncharacterized protein LOC119333921 n=1 Tax=Triticum dicoccoides TaxID=85692 RepID=UPI00188E0B26|nr:uncharacterized protein LOC119333921 [Triticum dicoccoides]
MNSEQTTEEGLMELTPEDYEEFRPLVINSHARFEIYDDSRFHSVRSTEERRMELDYANFFVPRFRQPERLRHCFERRVYGMTLLEPTYGLRLQQVRAQAAAHFRRSTFGVGSGHINETMSAEASSPGGGDGRLGVEWNDETLTALRSSARAMREHGGSQDFLVNEAGGRFIAIHIHPPQQGDQGLVGGARGAQDGPGDLARQALPSVIGGLVPLCFNLLLDDSILKAGGSPGYIKAAAYAGLGLVTVFTFLGLASKKRAKAAARVVASASTAAVSIAVVYQVSDNANIKRVCGIMGCVATLATMAIDW